MSTTKIGYARLSQKVIPSNNEGLHEVFTKLINIQIKHLDDSGDLARIIKENSHNTIN